MDRISTHRITVCTSCKHGVGGSVHKPGASLILALRAELDTEGEGLTKSFNVSGAACMAGCDSPCTVAFQEHGKATYLFGDIGPEDVPNLVSFARQYALLHDGWCSSVDRPGKLRHTTLARVPAVLSPVNWDLEAAE